ncbi:hypothetical protein D9M68_944370 [compost metagenome]
MLAAEVADVVATVVGRVLREAGHQRAAAQRLADQVARHLRDALAIKRGLKDEFGVVVGQPGGRLAFAHLAVDLELPFEQPARGQTEIDALVVCQFLHGFGQALPLRIGG